VVRIAIVSDIHGNLPAFEAVLTDLKLTSPDLILHGGDLPHGGAHPAEIVDRIRDLGWPGVLGNTDEMLFDPDSLAKFAAQSPKFQALWDAIAEMAAFTRQALGADRLAWLRELPMVQVRGRIALVHASPDSTWRSPMPEASDEELESVYAPLGHAVAVYAHVHRPFIRTLSGGCVENTMTVVNTGSVSMPYDGDPRASYLLMDDATPSIRRVEYEVEREIGALATCGLPHADWVARILKGSRPEMP
jgi:predicted phosphodiesterase